MSNDTAIEVTFPKLNHFWLDSGLLGLYELLHEAENGTLITLDDSKLTMRGKEEAIEAARTLARIEGIIPALESAHAVAGLIQRAPQMKNGEIVILNVSGRGDKDMETLSRYV